MSVIIREATEADYPAMSGIWNEVYPARASSVEVFTREIQDALASPLGLHWRHWVAERAGQVVAYASVEQYAGLYHTDRYHAGVMVLPGARQQGIGGALARVVQEHLQQRGAREVLAGHYESDMAAPGLLARYGLQEVQRYFDGHLDLTSFDFQAWQEKLALPDSLRLVSFADLKREVGDEEAIHVYYDLYTDTVRDVPAPGERTMPTLERFEKRLQNEHFRPDGVLLALTPEGQAVAFTELWTSENDDPHCLNIGFTCTRREWRGKGLALALKLHAMRDAQHEGFRRITTNAESGNAPMLSLNNRLGFTWDEAFIECKWGKV